MIGMVAGDGSDADRDEKNIPTGPYEEVGVCAPLNFFWRFLGAPLGFFALFVG